ncbi:MAG: hypothetical protein IJE68_02990 [Clostridia bacterium]|nr:hypothetical protein [Clostridia bacterium]
MNIYDEIKSRLTNQDVARYYLGPPKRTSGNTLMYLSPFRNERHPSFAVNDKGFIDFASGEHGSDMIEFIRQLKGFTHPHEAAQELIETFNLGIEAPCNSRNLKQKKINVKANEIVFSKGNTTNNIICMFDSIEYRSKPQKEQIGYIKNRIPNLKMQEYSLDEIKEYIIKGKTIIPSGIKGNATSCWERQQVFLVDFDNTYKNEKYYKGNPKHVTVDDIVNYCRQINFEPTFIYNTFSNSEEQSKFRLVYVLENPITEYLIASQIPSKLLEIFEQFNPDVSKQNLSDMFFGGTKIVYSSEICYNVDLHEAEIDKIEYEEVKKDEKMSHDMIANILLRENNICVYENTLYIYEQGVYRQNEKYINKKIIEIYPKATLRLRKEVMAYLLTIAPERNLEASSNIINFKNNLFNISNNEIIPHSPNYFTINQINANINANKKIKINYAIDNFLNRITCDNEERKKAILEMIGYSMTNSVDLQRAFVLYGKTAGNGKSTLLEIIEQLIGKENISHVTLQDLVSNRFSVSELKGKLVNIVSEMTKEFLKDSSLFKQVVTGDTITVEEKFKERYSIKPYAKHIFTANELPKIADTSNGYFRRLFIIPFEATFTEEEKRNFNFKELITQEALDYLAAISINQFSIMKHFNQFSNNKESNTIIENYKLDTNSVLSYLKDKDRMCNLLRSGCVRKRNEVFADYINYCKDSGYIHKGRNKFYEEVMATGLVEEGMYNGYATYKFDKSLISKKVTKI